jgi:xanthine dehydrogenase YagS FAD-binding subunit
MRPFEHVDVTSPNEAIEVLGGPGTSRLIAGGTDLIPAMRQGLVAPDRLVNLKTIAGLREITLEDGHLRIGALARLAEVARHTLVRANFPALAEAIELAASPQIRSQATIGGSLCQESRCWYYRGPFPCWLKGGEECFARHGANSRHAIFQTRAPQSPCVTVHPSDSATALVALGAQVRLLASGKARVVPAEGFFTIPSPERRQLTSLQPSEVVVGIDLPWPAPGQQSVFLKAMDRAAFGFALVSVAAVVVLDGPTIRSARLCLGGVAPIPWRVSAAERTLLDQELNASTITRCARATTEGTEPLADNRYKIALTEGLVKQALEKIRV